MKLKTRKKEKKPAQPAVEAAKGSTVNRREFIKGAAATAAAISLGPALPDIASATSETSPGNAPYVTTLTPEKIKDNNIGWVYYGAEANDRPLTPADKAQMKPEDFDKDAVVLKCSCYYPNASDIGHGIHWETFSFLEYQFGGRLRFERYFGQSLHSLQDGWKALRAGLVHVGQTYHLHNQGAFSMSHADGLPFLFNSVVVATQVMEEMYPKWFKKEYEAQGVSLAWIPHFDVQGLICKTPIRRLEDLKGKRIMGFGGEVLRDTLIALGATPVSLPTPDTFIGLQRGVVDGVAWAVGSIIPWRFHEVAKYLTVTGLTVTRIDYGFNREKFFSLPKEFQKELYYKFQLAGNHMSEGYTKLEDRGFDDLKKNGVEMIFLDPDEKKRWVAVGDTIWDKWVQKNEAKGLPAKEFVKDFRATAAKYNAMSIRGIREQVQDPKNMIHGIVDGF
ncbi:MAG: TRAP transporter substrate-binding protein DctP [Desulfovibrio sp.]|jgi:TRAP-type C4-dicarboxylate transport system substrate-binding protein|nr:TRAP transporter substrate-binding protein DctP [Desulfovibrio sp.]